MEIEYYKGQIARLRKNYGSGSYPQETAKVIWEAVSHMSSERFGKAIDRCLAENPKYPFGLNKIELALSSIREEVHRKEKIERNKNAPSMKEISEAIGDILKNL